SRDDPSKALHHAPRRAVTVTAKCCVRAIPDQSAKAKTATMQTGLIWQPTRKKFRAAMAKITNRRRPGCVATTILWISLISITLLLAVLMESMCLGILYVTNSLKGKDTSLFANQHLLTSPFASAPPAPIPGKYFDFNWIQFVVGDELLGWRLAPS